MASEIEVTAASPPRATARLGLGCLGLLLVGLAGPPLWIALLPSLFGAGDPTTTAVGGALGLLGLLFGTTLLLRGMRGGSAARPRFGRRGAPSFLLLLLLVLVAGGLLQRSGGPALTLLPVAHFLAALLPALALVAVVARRTRGAPLATVLTGITWGGLGATAIALVLEGVFLMLMALVVTVGLSLDGGEALSGVREALGEMSAGGGDPEALLSALQTLVSLPGVILAGYGIFALLGPAVEELAKLAGVILAAPRTRQGALLRGVAVGAGFGLVETVLLGASAFGASPTAVGAAPQMAALSPEVGWPALMGMRAVTTTMHAACSGLAALGWHAMSEQRRLAAGALRVGLAILVHGLWNGLILTVLWSSVRWASSVSSALPEGDPLPLAISAVATAALIALAWTLLLGLRWMAGRIRPRLEPRAATPPA